MMCWLLGHRWRYTEMIFGAIAYCGRCGRTR
jgi:hypothetical protein